MRYLIFILILLSGFAFSQKKELDFDRAVGMEFLPERVSNVNWRDNTTPTWKQSDSPHVLFHFDDKIDTLMNIVQMNKRMVNYGDSLSRMPTGQWIDKDNYQFKTSRGYWSYDLSSKDIDSLFRFDPEATNNTLAPGISALAFTKDQDIYFQNRNFKTVRITDDGGGDISNGICVHQREFGIINGIFWSPDDHYIAFYREDKTPVIKYPYVDFTTRPATAVPEMYPMAGMKNTTVTVWVYDIRNDNLIQLQTGEPADQYFTNITWSSDEKTVYIAHVNRDQNHMRLISYDPINGLKKNQLFEETHEKHVEPDHGPIFLNGSDAGFLWYSKRDGWNHLYLYDKDGTLKKQLTKGSWEVTEVYGIDPENQFVYINCTKDTPLDRTIYRVDISDGSMKPISLREGFHTAYFSEDYRHVLDGFSSGTNPGQLDYVDLNTWSRTELFKAADPNSEYIMPSVKINQIKAADGRTDLYTRIILPPDFEKSKRYPVIVYVYGGPHVQLIQNRWNYGIRGWLYYMAASGYIIYTVDARGTGFRGSEFEQSTFRRLSEPEIEDQLMGVEYLKSLTFVDSSRIGVQGWSYGGYMTTSLMLRSNGAFKVGVAGAPVIDWKYYESVYTERYMDTPEKNPDGYKMANVLNYVDNLEGRLLVIHGTSDPVVMWQNSILFVKTCITKMKMVDYMIYPGHVHGIRGKDRKHLYKTMTRYFDDFLK